jgi:glycosyltransferase involved in cell wall biosynthesis
VLLWYTHWHGSRSLRLATRVSQLALSVDRASFPIATPKVRGIGHAIDVERFDGGPPAAHTGPLRLLALGRTARWKGLATLAEAFGRADIDATLEIRGPSLTADELAHRRELASIPDPRIRVEEPVTRSEIPALLRSVDVVVNPAEPRTGAALDKAVYEACACGRPVVSTNRALTSFLGGLPLRLIAPPRDPDGLAEVLREVADGGVGVRAEVGEELRRRVVEHHSLGHWADEVIRAISDVRSPRGR